MKKKNLKGMTLVEVIVAMAVFSVITTGFMLSATYAIKAQKQAKLNLTETNSQTTDLENYAGAVDFDATTLNQLSGGENLWTMTFSFPTGDTIENSLVHGYTHNTSSDEILQLGFFSAVDRINLNSNEYWITLYNYSSEDVFWDITCTSGFVFFDNEGNTLTTLDSMPTQGVMCDGGCIKFGIRDIGGGDKDNAITITNWSDASEVASIGITGYVDEDNYAFAYFTGSEFLNGDDFDAWFVPAEE